MRALFAALVSCAMLGALSCSNYADMLQRGQAYYERNEYERALSVWRHLDADRDSLAATERVRYYYYRGMTDFRLGYPTEARYWLGLAQASRGTTKGALDEAEGKRLEETLAGLSKTVFGLETPEKDSDEQVLGEKCAWSSECEPGFVCEDGYCVQTDAGLERDEGPDESGDTEPGNAGSDDPPR